MARETQDPKKPRKPYIPPAIAEEDDFSEDTLLHFAPDGPFPNVASCGGSSCPG